MECPAQALQHLLAEAIPLTGGGGRVIHSAVALDPQNIAAWLFRIDHGHVATAGRDDVGIS